MTATQKLTNFIEALKLITDKPEVHLIVTHETLNDFQGVFKQQREEEPDVITYRGFANGKHEDNNDGIAFCTCGMTVFLSCQNNK
jgi:hypothetical protein